MEHGRAWSPLLVAVVLSSCTSPRAQADRVEGEDDATARLCAPHEAEPATIAPFCHGPEETGSEPRERAPRIVFDRRYESAVAFPGSLGASWADPWRDRVPAVEMVSIRSSLDGAPQRAAFYDSGSERDKPLLVVLHSWSATYLQNIAIPYARFAIDNDWVFVHPDFRGRNRRPEATNSELAVQDVIDAVEHARERARVDDSRIYLMGYSGGAMMALVLAGRYPERWAGVATWVAVVDLVDWHRTMHLRGSRYAREIAASCGGAPWPGTRAAVECLRRSPLTYLPAAAGRTPIYIAHGIEDRLASPAHAIRAFNALAAPEDRIEDEVGAAIARAREVPPQVRRDVGEAHPAFERAGTPVVLQRTSREATLVLFDGDHDMLYEPGLRWLAEQRRG